LSDESTKTAYGIDPAPGRRHSRQRLVAGSYIPTRAAFHSLIQIRLRESDQARRAPWSRVGGRRTVAFPVRTSIRPR
jgi:hypothetical protein